MAFPTTPTNNQQASVNNIAYTYNSTLGAWAVTTQTGALDITASTLTTSAGVTNTGSRSFFSATNEAFAVGAKYVSTGGAVYFGATDGTATPGGQISHATGSAAMSWTSGGAFAIPGTVRIGGATVGTLGARTAADQQVSIAPGPSYGGADGIAIVSSNDLNNAYKDLAIAAKTVFINTSGGTGNITLGGSGTTVSVPGNLSSAGSTTLNPAGSLTVPTLHLSDATSKWISLAQGGIGAPTFTTRSAGVKLALWPAVTGTDVDFGFGIESGSLWSSVNTTASSFKWYAGTTLVATLTGAGALSATSLSGSLSLTANTSISGIKNATFNSQVTIATTTGAITVNWSNAQNQLQTEPTGAITYTFTAPSGVCHCQLLINSDGISTAQVITWPASVKWMGDTWTGVNNKAAVINFWYDGTSYWAMGSNQV